LNVAVAVFVKALSDPENPDVDQFLQAFTLFKSFLQNALTLGPHVWTRFDSLGMVCGVSVLVVAILMYAWPLCRDLMVTTRRFPISQTTEVALTALFILFTCGLCTFSNSYILEEENSIMFCLAVLSIGVALRIRAVMPETTVWKAILLLPLLSRVAELLISGHGLDPSQPVHAAHHSAAFLTSLSLIGLFRWLLFRYRIMEPFVHLIADLASLVFLALSWWEKRLPDQELNGYMFCRIELVLLTLSLAVALVETILRSPREAVQQKNPLLRRVDKDILVVLFKVLIAIMTVTGPSTASSLVIYTIQIAIIYIVSLGVGSTHVSSMVVAALLRLVTRHGE
jgi:hypothetical protein